MQLEDTILISIDDHYIEPPNMYKNHVPSKYLDQAPKVVRNAQGVDEWMFQGESTSTPFGMTATVGWLSEQCGFNPATYTEVFRDHILACFITDPSGLSLRDRIGIEIIAWECDYPHRDTTWPESPEYAWKEFQDTGCTDEEIHKITWANTARSFDWDPFKLAPRDQATVGALRSLAKDVDVTRMSKEEWRERNEALGVGVF